MDIDICLWRFHRSINQWSSIRFIRFSWFGDFHHCPAYYRCVHYIGNHMHTTYTKPIQRTRSQWTIIALSRSNVLQWTIVSVACGWKQYLQTKEHSYGCISYQICVCVNEKWWYERKTFQFCQFLGRSTIRMEIYYQLINSIHAPWPIWWWAMESITKIATRGPGNNNKKS